MEKLDENRHSTSTEQDLVLKGAYDYLYEGNIYSEEMFQVYKVRRDSSLIYKGELLTRLETGEFLKMYCVYKINKEWTPISVTIEKFIGNTRVQENFSTPIKGTTLVYEFKADKGAHSEEVLVPPRYQVATPHTFTTFLFLSSKKYDPTGRNYYNILTSENDWEYAHPPLMKYILLERISTTPVEIELKGKPIKAMHYQVYGHSDDAKQTEKPINIYMSRHFNVPYLVEFSNEIKIQIRFLQEFERPTIDD